MNLVPLEIKDLPEAIECERWSAPVGDPGPDARKAMIERMQLPLSTPETRAQALRADLEKTYRRDRLITLCASVILIAIGGLLLAAFVGVIINGET